MRDRQDRLMRLERKIREYNIYLLKNASVEEQKKLIEDLNLQWSNLGQSLEQKLIFCLNIHKGHKNSIDEYLNLKDFFDKSSFSKRVQNGINTLEKDKGLSKMSIEQLKRERDRLKVFVDRLNSDLNDEIENNRELRN